LQNKHLPYIGRCSLPKDTEEIETRMAEKSCPVTRQTNGKTLGLVLRNKERKLAKLSMPIPLLAVLPLVFFDHISVANLEVTADRTAVCIHLLNMLLIQ
jgi:hypothetical protein